MIRYYNLFGSKRGGCVIADGGFLNPAWRYGLTKSAALEEGPRNIRVNCIAPSAFTMLLFLVRVGES